MRGLHTSELQRFRMLEDGPGERRDNPAFGACCRGSGYFGALVADRTGLPAAALLPLVGIGYALLPGPNIRLDPEVVLTLVLPPLLYSAALDSSLLAIRRHLRTVVSLSVMLVLLTAIVIGVGFHWLVTGRPWPPGSRWAEFGQVGPAEQRLSEAVTQARHGADNETLGRAGVALGIFLQHEGRLPEARTVLEEGLSALDPVHPDALIWRSHLAAIVDGRTCGCGDLKGTIEDAYRQFVIGRLPADLLDDLAATVEGGDFQVHVKLDREATEDEIERMNGVIQSAVAEFRRRIARP
jgi:hypothetical protein